MVDIKEATRKNAKENGLFSTVLGTYLAVSVALMIKMLPQKLAEKTLIWVSYLLNQMVEMWIK